MKWKAAFDALLQTVYPPDCIFCGQRLTAGKAICPACRKTVRPAPENREISLDGNTAFRCRGIYPYNEQVRRAILCLKFQERKGYGAAFGRLMAEDAAVREMARQADWVTAVPISKKRLRQRGYSQAALIAGELARLCGRPYRETLEKHIHNRAQSALNREERLENVRGVYRALPDASLGGASILLVDDVVTTGATLGACADVLNRAGARLVTAAVFAHTTL